MGSLHLPYSLVFWAFIYSNFYYHYCYFKFSNYLSLFIISYLLAFCRGEDTKVGIWYLGKPLKWPKTFLPSFTWLLVCFWVLKMDSTDIRMAEIKPWKPWNILGEPRMVPWRTHNKIVQFPNVITLLSNLINIKKVYRDSTNFILITWCQWLRISN